MDNRYERIEPLLRYLEKQESFYLDYGQIQPEDSDITDERIIIGNWNVIPDKRCRAMQDFMDSIDGISYDYYDEYCRCGCGDFILTNPQYYGWTPNYIMGDGFILCRACVEGDIETLIDEYKNSTDQAIPNWAIDLVKKEGFTCLDDMTNETCVRYQAGLHLGMNDDPTKIMDNLSDEFGFDITDKYDYLFCVTSTGQFDVNFTLFLREIEED